MKLHTSIAALSLLAMAPLCNAADYMDEIAKSACECAAKIPDSTPANGMKAQLGICMIQPLVPYKKQLKADFGLDLDRMDVDGERIGQVVGLRLASHCPATIIKFGSRADEEEKGTPAVSVEGVVSRIDKDFFVVFSVKDGEGKTVKLYWMSEVSSTLDLINNYGTLMGKSVKVEYRPTQFFDPKIGDYRPFNVITRIAQ